MSQACIKFGAVSLTAKTPSFVIYDLARRLLSGDLTDPTDGATHFYTPGAMPKEGGEIPPGSNTAGGLKTVPGVTDEDGNPVRDYKPKYAKDKQFKQVIVKGVKDFLFKFYKEAGNTKVR